MWYTILTKLRIKKSHGHLNRCRKSFWKNSTSIYDKKKKTLNKVCIEEIYLNTVVVVQSLSHVWLCNPMNCSTTGFSVHHYLLKFPHTHVHWVSDAVQPSLPPLLPFPLALNFPQHQGLFQWVSSLHQMAKVLELQLQHQSFQWIFRVDFL